MCHKVESAPRSRPAPPPAHTYKTVLPELHTAVQRLKLMKLFIAVVMFDFTCDTTSDHDALKTQSGKG